MQLKIDLHVHTIYSADSLITPEQLVLFGRKKGLDGVAVTDHDRLDSALMIAKQTDFLIIPGMEITSSDGHIIALNLNEPVPKGLPADETVDKIHDYGGIAIACHPIGFFKGSLGKHASSRFDAIEVINASAIPFGYAVRRSEELASVLRKPRVAGSDGHYAPEIGYGYTVVNAEKEVDNIVKAIASGSCLPFGKAIPLSLRFRKIIDLNKRPWLKEKGDS